MKPTFQILPYREPDRLLTLSEAAKFTGLKRSTLRDWVYERDLPAIKIGGRLRFQFSHLKLLLEAIERSSLSSLPKKVLCG